MTITAGLIPRKVFVHSPKGGFQSTRYFRQDEPLHQYFKEINAVPLLTQEEETKLANKYQKQKDQAAGAQLVRANLRLVAKVAYTYTRSRIPLADLIQQGNLGLIAAVKKFDPKKARLSTYATQWIKAYINRSVKDSFVNTNVESEIPEQEGSKQLISHVIDPERAYAVKEEQDRINSAVNKLNSNEQHIVRNRLLTDDPRSLEEVGSEIGLSKQKAFSLEKQAIAKLKQFLTKGEVVKAIISTIEEEFQKAQVKGYTRTRKGKLERVNPFSRQGDKLKKLDQKYSEGTRWKSDLSDDELKGIKAESAQLQEMISEGDEDSAFEAKNVMKLFGTKDPKGITLFESESELDSKTWDKLWGFDSNSLMQRLGKPIGKRLEGVYSGTLDKHRVNGVTLVNFTADDKGMNRIYVHDGDFNKLLGKSK